MTNLSVGTIETSDTLIGDHLIHLMFIGIDITFGTIDLIIHLIGDLVGIDGIDGIMDGDIGIDYIDLFIIGIIGIMVHGTILLIM